VRIQRSGFVRWIGCAVVVSTLSVNSGARAATYNLHGAPDASFLWFPTSPRVNEVISLASTSTDLSSPITSFSWDTSDNGPFGAFVVGGPIASASFATPAPHVVRLRVTAGDGLSSIAAGTIHMSAPPPGVMTPFPIVRIVGRDFRTGVRLRLLAVQAPRGASIAVTCRSRACPARLRGRVVRALGKGSTFVRMRPYQRFFHANARIELRVTEDGVIGAYTSFKVRRRRLPVRTDSCLSPGGIEPIACPTM
jgi:hypothetical protein